MNLKKQFLLVVTLVAVSVFGAFAQSEEVGATDPAKLGDNAGEQNLKEVSITKFEDAAMWKASMSSDYGLTTVRKFEGGAIGKEPIEEEEALGLNEADEYALGVKVNYLKRAVSSFFIFPSNPMAVEGICKTVSVWVIGRNAEHNLKLLVRDHYGNKAELTMGKLNFSGWKKLTATIPETLIQQDYHYVRKTGIEIEGFKVECNPEETYGTYYIYFDDMRAITDLYPVSNRDENDIVDMW